MGIVSFTYLHYIGKLYIDSQRGNGNSSCINFLSFINTDPLLAVAPYTLSRSNEIEVDTFLMSG